MKKLLIGREGAVATIRLNAPPHNFFDLDVLTGIADALAANDSDKTIRITLLTAEGRSFCAGADFARPAGAAESPAQLAVKVYEQGARIFDRAKPLVAAVGGPAVGGGLGLAMSADFRVACPAARFHANFAAIGLHPGFALTATLPHVVGAQRARAMLLGAQRIGGEEAVAIGLADRLAPDGSVDVEAMAFAQLIAANAPLALATIAAALPRIDGKTARAATAAELAAQASLFPTRDFREGVRAVAERRPPRFTGE